jgi:hypothetical protein
MSSASFCPGAPGLVATYGTPLSPVFAVNAPLGPETGLISASLAKNPTTSRPPMAAVIRVSTCSRDGFGVRSSRREALARKCRVQIRVRCCTDLSRLESTSSPLQAGHPRTNGSRSEGVHGASTPRVSASCPGRPLRALPTLPGARSVKTLVTPIRALGHARDVGP